jgi:CMP-N-acetylneuraminic acid synthetase
VSVTEDLSFHYVHGAQGLMPLRPQRRLRLERDALYEENGALYLSWCAAMTPESFFGQRIGHIVMPPEDSVQIDTAFERWMVEQMLLKRPTTQALAADVLQPAPSSL